LRITNNNENIFARCLYKIRNSNLYICKTAEYNKINVALRTRGRGIVVESPSGIDKTTSIQKAIEELGLNKNVLKSSARKSEDN
jgi:hypothetical protein